MIVQALDGANAILVVSPRATIESCNGFFLQLLGVEHKDLVGKNVSVLFPLEKDGDEFMRQLRSALTESDFHRGQMTLRGPDSRQVPLMYQASALRDSRDRRLCFVVVAQDMRALQDRLRQGQSVVKFSDEMPFPVLRVARDGTLLYANNGSWLLLAHWNCAVGQAVPPAWREKIEEALRQEGSQEVEVQIGFKTLLLIMVSVVDMGYVDFFGLDVTSRKQAEKRLLIHSQVFDSATEGIVITDADRRILDVNRAFTTITGYSREEILGENIDILQSGRHDEAFYAALWNAIGERGSWQGEVWDRRKNGEIHPKWLSISSVTAESGKIIRYIGLFSDISVMKQTQDQLYQMAHYDSLTGLPNRRYFHDRLQGNLEQARRAGEPLALMFMDLDGFKLINDNLGHRAGDQLLRKAADRIKECVRESDTVARMGGDEFTVMLSQIKSSHAAALVAQKILQRVYEPISLENQEIFVSSSIGIAIFPNDASDVEGLLQCADTALYKAKELGKNGYQFFSREMNLRAMERLTLQTQIRQGLNAHEFMVYYQPQISARTGELVGLEALARWQSPHIGLVGPEQFIPLAEETGLIHELGETVLRSVFAQGKLWRDEGYAPVRLAVNISAHQLRRSDFATQIEEIAAECSFPLEYLELEVTESVLVEDNEEDLRKLQRLKSLGILLTIDDFGTKYSSLAYLKQLPIDRLKIDKSFVRDLPGDSRGVEIASAIIAMSRSLNLEVVAEGVETEGQAAILREIGCHYLQGYHYSRPLPPQDIRPLLRGGV